MFGRKRDLPHYKGRLLYYEYPLHPYRGCDVLVVYKTYCAEVTGTTSEGMETCLTIGNMRRQSHEIRNWPKLQWYRVGI